MAEDQAKELEAMKTAVTALADLGPEAQARAIKWIVESLKVPVAGGIPTASQLATGGSPGAGGAPTPPSEHPTPTAFMVEKRPDSDTERIACLAYYLSHWRNQQGFSSKDLEALNRDASQPPFSRTRTAVNNATRLSQFLVPAGQGKKQLTARGEAVVTALPDREKVKMALQEHRLRRRGKRGAKKPPKTVK